MNDSNEEIHKEKVNYVELDSFHKAVAPVLFFTQFLALMPVVGILNANPYRLRFHFQSKAMLPVLCFLFFGSIFAVLYFNKIFADGLTAKTLVGIIFYVCGFSVCILFLFLARNWPGLMKNWFETEMIFLNPPYTKMEKSLSRKIRLAATVVIISALVEHLFSYASAIRDFKAYTLTCNISQTMQHEAFFEYKYSHIYTIIPYSLPTIIGSILLNFCFTFLWNYMDLFIVMVSLGMSTRFRQINHRIESLTGKDVSESLWWEIRHHFVLLCELLETVDEAISRIILLSSLNNLYFICFQLLNILNKLPYTINYVYYWFSLLYLVFRTTCVFLHAASINDEAVKPLKTLRSVPSEAWFDEIERFVDHITTQKVALSGMNFFYLTRKLFFGMAGTIVTYELVLLQFDSPRPRASSLCPLRCC